MKKVYLLLFVLVITVFLSIYSIKLKANNISNIPNPSALPNAPVTIPSPKPSLSPSPASSPTPKPLTFSETNARYGPCTKLPVLMYHHVQSKETATLTHQTALSVYTDVFTTQMQYLKGKGYVAIAPDALISFFDSGAPIPSKSILITFDDGYEDFFTNAYPILNSNGFKATVFTPTGLVNNSGYLTWDQIGQMNGSGIFFGNHTWSHKNLAVDSLIMQKEISTADGQLADHGLNSSKIFAYPYGLVTKPVENYLQTLGYKVAFSTQPGNVQCKSKRLELPRIRIGNSSMAVYGF